MRREFSKTVKRDAAARCGGKCEACGKRLRFGDYHYDHDLPDFLGGEPTLENCRVLCIVCHKAKTRKFDTPRIVKSRGQRDMALNIKASSRLAGAGFRKVPPQHRATSPSPPKFEGDILARKEQP
jgi:5-methylcytosine-specific restriction protein A